MVLKTLLFLMVLAACVGAVWTIGNDVGIWVAVEVALALAGAGILFSLMVPPRYAASITNIGGGYRAVGPGWHFIGRPGEWLDKLVEVKKSEILFVAKPDTAGRDVVAVKVIVGGEPSIPYLPEYLRFEAAQREAAVKNRVEGLLTKLGHLHGSFDAIYTGGDDISAKLMLLFHEYSAGGMSFEEYCGWKVNYIYLADITPPEMVRDAAAQKRVAEVQVETLRIKMRGYAEQVDEMVARDPKLSRRHALEKLMAVTGAIPQTTINHTYEAGPDLNGTLRGITEFFKT